MTTKARVMFVDDEPHILHGIRRSMSDMEDEWDMVLCASGQEALDLMATEAFDVVVTDMRMPRMDGAELLNTVRKLHPGTIRLILSGYADSDSVLRTIGPAHAYLAKPCDADALRDAIRRQIALRALLNSPRLRATLAGLTNLPSLPDVFLRLQAELLSRSSSAKSIADIIGADLAMTAEILKLTNSAYFSTSGAAATPLHAVRLLGVEIIQALVLKVGVFRQFSGKPEMAPILESLTAHSLAVADLAERIAVAEGADIALGKAARIAAMLKDIGSVVLFDAHPNEYHAMLSQVGPAHPLNSLEEAKFGASHALIGAYLLGLWGFCDTIVEAIIYCCHPRSCPRRDNLALTALHAACVLGPPSPLIPADRLGERRLDSAYLIEARQDGHVHRWEEMAAGRKGEG